MHSENMRSFVGVGCCFSVFSMKCKYIEYISFLAVTHRSAKLWSGRASGLGIPSFHLPGAQRPLCETLHSSFGLSVGGGLQHLVLKPFFGNHTKQTQQSSWRPKPTCSADLQRHLNCTCWKSFEGLNLLIVHGRFAASVRVCVCVCV